MSRVLIFDYDGVIVDSLDAIIKMYNSRCEEFGYPPIDNKNEFVKLFESNLFTSLKKMGISSFTIFKSIRTFKKEFKELQSHMPFFKDMKEVLNRLSKNNLMYIVTSNISSIVEDNLRKNKLSFFREIIGEDKGRNKAKRIKKIKKKFPGMDIYYIGDTKWDIKEGKKAGVKTVGVTWGYHTKKMLKEVSPDYLISRPKEFLRLFK